MSYDVRVQTSRKFDKHSETICKISELEEEIKALEKELEQKIKETEQIIKQLDHGLMEQIIRKRYIDLKTWEEITREINHSKRWILELHRKAIKKLIIFCDITIKK